MFLLFAKMSVFDSASSQAQAVSDVFVTTLLICGGIFAIVTVLVLWCIFFFRQKGDGEPRQVFGNLRVEVVWTVIPALIVVWLFVLTWRAMDASNPTPSMGLKPDLIVTGHQWWWEATYPGSGVIVANEIHIPTGKKWLVKLDSADVIHSFWVPQLSPKMDMIPGHPNHLWLEADRPGTYLGACAEYCGAQHAWMRFLVIAHPPAEFEAWQKQQLKSAPPVSVLLVSKSGARYSRKVPADAAARGEQVFRDMTCINCHAIQGVGTARVGPDLTHLASRRTLAAGLMDNTPNNLAEWLKNAQAFKPGSHMPNLQLTDAQVSDLVAYFETLK